jgi:uncharacterized membrane protein
MNMFTWLVMGHLVGDWLLQNDWMAKGKKQSLFTTAGMAHFVIYTLTVMVTFWLAAGSTVSLVGYVLVALVVFVSHWLTDATDVVGAWIRLMRQTDIPMVRIMVDQTFHLIILAGIALAV